MGTMRSLRILGILLLVGASLAAGFMVGARSPYRPLPPPPAPNEPATRIARKFNELYWQADLPQHKTFWLGIRTQQIPTDLWSIQQILYEVRPDYIVETGTLSGGSALFHAMVLRQINPDGRIITIDINPQTQQASQHELFRSMVDVWTASSTSPQTLARVTQKVRGRRTLVILDSNHAREHVAEELRLYSPLVPLGSYIIVHDTNLYGDGPPPVEGPQAAVQEFLAAHPEFQLDRSREAMMLTLSGGGYLKRIPH